jgi:hypothetical protein
MDFWEHPGVPPLNAPIPVDSPQGIMLRLAHSFQESMQRGDAFVIKSDQGRQHFEMAMQSKQGFSVRWRRDASNTALSREPSAPDRAPFYLQQPPQPLDLALVARPDRIDILSAAADRRFTLKDRLQLTMHMDFSPEPNDKNPPVSFNFDAGFNEDSDMGDPPIRLRCSLAPVVCLDFVTPRSGSSDIKPKIELRDGVLQVDGQFGSMRVDAASGRLIKWTSGPLEFEFAKDPEIARGLMPRSVSNDYDPRHPVSSLVRFLAACNSSSPFFALGSSARASAIVNLTSSAAGPVLESLDRGVTESSDEDDDFDDAGRHVDSQNPTAIAHRWVGYVNYVFEYGSWPWTISRQVMLALGGGSPDAQPEFVRVVNSEQTGPIGFIALATAMGASPTDAQAMASIGLDRVSAEAFKHDFHVLFESQGIGPKALSNLLQAVSDLSNDQFSALTAAIPADWVGILDYVRQVGKEHPGQPVVDALAQSSDKWWDASVRKIVKDELDRESGGALSSDQGGQ